MSLPRTLPSFSPEDYLLLERATETRHEYLDGFVYAMAGESPRHSTICYNLAGLTHARLRGKPCQGFSPNMKVRTDTSNLFSYPDLAVVCGEPVFHDKQGDVLLNPTAVFEVLSPSTEAYDRGEKVLRYTTQIETLRSYVLVAQDRPHVEHYERRPDGSWARTDVDGLENVLNLSSIGSRLPLAEIYERINFEAQP